MNIADSAISEAALTPILVSVKQAAQMLGVSPWTCYQLADAGEIQSRYMGRRRLIVFESLRNYAEGLPTERPEAAGA